MTKDEVIFMARKAGAESLDLEPVEFDFHALIQFAALVAANERDACADIVENANTPDCGGWTALGIAAAIRARGNHD